MAYLAQPIIVGSSNVVVVGDGHTSTMNLAGNIVRSSHFIPDPSSAAAASADSTSLHPSLKSLPYPLALPPVMSPTNGTGADLAGFEEDEDDDADTEDSRSLLSVVESLNDGSSSINVGSFRDNVMVGSLRGQSTLAANVRSPSRSPATYQRFEIPAGVAHATIPTVPGAAVASNSSVLTSRDTRVPGTRVQHETSSRSTPRAGAPVAAQECNVCYLELGVSSPTVTNSSKVVANPCPSAHKYHFECFQSTLLHPAIAGSTLPTCPAPCSQHVPARSFLHIVSPMMKQRYLQAEVEMMSRDDGDAT